MCFNFVFFFCLFLFSINLMGTCRVFALWAHGAASPPKSSAAQQFCHSLEKPSSWFIRSPNCLLLLESTVVFKQTTGQIPSPIIKIFCFFPNHLPNLTQSLFYIIYKNMGSMLHDNWSNRRKEKWIINTNINC